MKKFKEWCNQNPGYLTFWTLVCGIFAIIITIVIASRLTFNPSSLLTFFNIKIPIPIYIILLFIVVLFIVFRKMRKPNEIPNPKEKFIYSDQSTIFIGSTTYPSLPKRIPSQICPQQSWLSHSRKYPILSKANWISHTFTITNDEAVNGGFYTYEREFEFDMALNKLEKALLHLLVDDFCVLYVNNKVVENIQGAKKSEGYDNLHSFDIKSNLVKGNNTLKFEIENRDFRDLMRPGTQFFNSQNRGSLNPYGIIFTLIMTLK